MDPDSGATELDSSWVTPGSPSRDEPDNQTQDQELDPVLVWVPSGRRLISGLLGMNIVLLGAALVAGQTFNPEGLKHQEPLVFMLLLMGVSLIWMLWYLLWARKQPGVCPHKDHHAGGITVILVLILFAAASLLLYICRIGYLLSVRECNPVFVIFVFVLVLKRFFFIFTCCTGCRSGLMVILSADLLLWLNSVTEDSIHEEIELEKEDSLHFSNSTLCQCSTSAACLAFRKGFEILYPFNIEYYLMAGCMIYVMWKNVGRRTGPGHHVGQKLTLRVVYQGGIIYGLVFGGLVLVVGVTVFILYQVWVSQRQLRLTAFLIFYGYHLAVMPVMSFCSLAGMLVHRLERRAHEGGHNPTRSLDVILLVAAALGQLALSYFSLVAALALGTNAPLADLELSYSLLSLLELILQNIFIIEGLHRHPSLLTKKKERERSRGQQLFHCWRETRQHPLKRAIQEICAFLILCNIMLWVIPAFGVHPQFENGLGKQFFGFSTWFVLVNLGQPLSVFYRMHSVGALMELLISA
uniref:Otopetrin 3 n=1 Tax=Seriola lalandi dorsalis TaxID=1841481 RepID=A0A3B4YHA6_SERLL